MADETNKRRLRRVAVEYDEVLTVFAAAANPRHDAIALPVLTGLPEGYEVRGAKYDIGSNAIASICPRSGAARRCMW